MSYCDGVNELVSIDFCRADNDDDDNNIHQVDGGDNHDDDLYIVSPFCFVFMCYVCVCVFCVWHWVLYTQHHARLELYSFVLVALVHRATN